MKKFKFSSIKSVVFVNLIVGKLPSENLIYRLCAGTDLEKLTGEPPENHSEPPGGSFKQFWFRDDIITYIYTFK